MPLSSRCRAPSPKTTRIDRTEVDHPSANRLMGDKDAALSEKILDISEAQREAQVQPDSMLDHHWREPIAAIAERFHCQTLPTIKRPDHGSPLDVTSPFCGLLRSAMMASSRSRSLPVTSMLIPVRMHSRRTMDRVGGNPFRMLPSGFIH